MTPRAFLLAISLAGSLMASCPDDFTPESFEECSDEMAEFMNEVFNDRNLTLPLDADSMKKAGLKPVGVKQYEKPGSRHRYKTLSIPVLPGLWRVERDGELTILHTLLREPERLPETRAFNTYNDLLGGLWNDYDARAYGMTMMPEDRRVNCLGRYLGVSLKIYGTREDALDLNRTAADLILIDYTPMVRRYERCRKKR